MAKTSTYSGHILSVCNCHRDYAAAYFTTALFYWSSEQVTYILVLHVFEQPELSVGSLCVNVGLEGSGQLLHCYSLDCLLIER